MTYCTQISVAQNSYRIVPSQSWGTGDHKRLVKEWIVCVYTGCDCTVYIMQTCDDMNKF